MNIEILFEKFELFAEAPGAIPKMRNIILGLAIQGKLVPPNPKDESATSIIHDAKKTREHLKQKNQISIARTSEEHFRLPQNWIWTSLEEIALINPRNDAADHIQATFIPMAGISQDYRGAISGEIRSWGDIRKSFTHFADGDIVLAKITPCFQNGKSAVIRHLENGIGAGTTELHVARPLTKLLSPDYVYLFLKSASFIEDGIPEMTGTAGQKRIPARYFAGKPFPLPPFNEQLRIVEAVDELMALCNQLEAQQEERVARKARLSQASLAQFANEPTLENLRYVFHSAYDIDPADLRKSILDLAVRAKLVPQDSHDIPASELLVKIEQEKTQLSEQGKIRSSEKKCDVSDDEIPFDIPDSWAWTHLGTACFLITDGAHHTPTYQPSGVPFLSVKDVSSGTVSFEDTKFISESTHSELCRRCMPEFGDILLTKIGTTGIAVTVETDREFSLFVSLALLKFSKQHIDRFYLCHLINSPFVKRQSAEHTQGVGNKNLVLRHINQFIIPIPPLEEQKRIVTKVNHLMALVDQLELQLTESRTKATQLLNALVAELTASNTPQPPTEPAPVLQPKLPLDVELPEKPKTERKDKPANSQPGVSIDDLDEERLLCEVRAVFTRGKELSRDQAISEVARALHFGRTGPRIRERLESALNTASRRRIITTTAGMLTIYTPQISGYENEEKIQALRAVCGKWTTRTDAITMATRYFGFARTGNKIETAFKEAITLGLRRKQLEANGDSIRRA